MVKSSEQHANLHHFKVLELKTLQETVFAPCPNNKNWVPNSCFYPERECIMQQDQRHHDAPCICPKKCKCKCDKNKCKEKDCTK